ncbi:MAG: DHH family phosphoesterase [Patescibacteria group bacterium]|nr:DHH family phosphoesterase [Patescibacteria group bacterium]
MTDQIKELASKILETIQKSNKILLHCHPYPDPDSVGSVLAMSSALKKLGKNVTAIVGDTEYPQNLLEFPNREWIQPKNYTQIDLNEFDLFLILDSSSPSQITQFTEITFPKSMNTIVIDHHDTNSRFGKINLVEPTYSSTSQILHKLFRLWHIEIDPDMAICLFVGIFADTGGFKYPKCTPETLHTAYKLAKINPNYHKLIFNLENNKKPIEIEMTGLALFSIEKYFSDRVVFSVIPYEEIQKRKLSKSDAMEGLVANLLRAVIGWDLVASLVEAEPDVVTVSLRTRDENKFDVSKIAKSVGEKGGGHKGAAGTTIKEPLNKAKATLLKAIGQTFPELRK